MIGALLAIVGIIGVAYLLLTLSGGPDVSSSPQVQRLAQAIATAEGFYNSDGTVNRSSRPGRDHNPGDMTKDLIGKGIGLDGPFLIYGTDNDGWQNLYAQINLWLNGGSANADANSTITDLSGFYTTTNQSAWAANVANFLGVSVDTPIGQLS